MERLLVGTIVIALSAAACAPALHAPPISVVDLPADRIVRPSRPAPVAQRRRASSHPERGAATIVTPPPPRPPREELEPRTLEPRVEPEPRGGPSAVSTPALP